MPYVTRGPRVGTIQLIYQNVKIQLMQWCDQLKIFEMSPLASKSVISLSPQGHQNYKVQVQNYIMLPELMSPTICLLQKKSQHQLINS